MTEIDHSYTDEIVCPYCGEEQGDSWEAGADGEYTCGHDCGKTFMFERHTSVSYSTNKADCLNGADHRFKAYPRDDYPQHQVCRDCGKHDYGLKALSPDGGAEK